MPCLSEVCGKIALRELRPPLQAADSTQAADACYGHTKNARSRCSAKTKPARRLLPLWPCDLTHHPLTFPLLLEPPLLQVPAETSWAPRSPQPWAWRGCQGWQSPSGERPPAAWLLLVLLTTTHPPKGCGHVSGGAGLSLRQPAAEPGDSSHRVPSPRCASERGVAKAFRSI